MSPTPIRLTKSQSMVHNDALPNVGTPGRRDEARKLHFFLPSDSGKTKAQHNHLFCFWHGMLAAFHTIDISITGYDFVVFLE